MTTAARAQLDGRPLVFGEVLFDQFPDGKQVLGGAPFNVAWHLRGFGLNPLFVSRVGEDDQGDDILSRMRDWGMDTRGVQRDNSRPTGRVQVRIQHDQTSFDILKDQAYDYIVADPALHLLAEEKAAAIYFGSLIARSPVSRQSLESLRLSSDAPAFVDVNLRPPWWERDTIDRLVKAASWLKLNEHELADILEYPVPAGDISREGRAFRQRYGFELLVITLGAQGAYFITEDGAERGAPHPVANFVDAVGAGDAFSSVTLLGLCKGWPLSATLQRALEFAALICSNRGATLSERAPYERLLQSWAS